PMVSRLRGNDGVILTVICIFKGLRILFIESVFSQNPSRLRRLLRCINNRHRRRVPPHPATRDEHGRQQPRKTPACRGARPAATALPAADANDDWPATWKYPPRRPVDAHCAPVPGRRTPATTGSARRAGGTSPPAGPYQSSPWSSCERTVSWPCSPLQLNIYFNVQPELAATTQRNIRLSHRSISAQRPGSVSRIRPAPRRPVS